MVRHREVVVSTRDHPGGIRPQLAELLTPSGIGPAEQLKTHGILVLPIVRIGANLQDHRGLRCRGGSRAHWERPVCWVSS
jgi:hypothetical protein